jgi:hypothetical protein
VIILDLLDQFIIEFIVNLVLCLNLIQSIQLLFKLGLCGVIVLNYGGESTCRKGESDNADKHEQTADELFS